MYIRYGSIKNDKSNLPKTWSQIDIKDKLVDIKEGFKEYTQIIKIFHLIGKTKNLLIKGGKFLRWKVKKNIGSSFTQQIVTLTTFIAVDIRLWYRYRR